jgi:hypothetical protein
VSISGSEGQRGIRRIRPPLKSGVVRCGLPLVTPSDGRPGSTPGAWNAMPVNIFICCLLVPRSANVLSLTLKVRSFTSLEFVCQFRSQLCGSESSGNQVRQGIGRGIR